MLLLAAPAYATLSRPRLSWITMALPLAGGRELAFIIVPCSTTLPRRLWVFYREPTTDGRALLPFHINDHLITLPLGPHCPPRYINHRRGAEGVGG
jgi:hypothetical protein